MKEYYREMLRRMDETGARPIRGCLYLASEQDARNLEAAARDASYNTVRVSESERPAGLINKFGVFFSRN